MSSAFITVWRVRPLRLGRSTTNKPAHARPQPIQSVLPTRLGNVYYSKDSWSDEWEILDDSHHASKSEVIPRDPPETEPLTSRRPGHASGEEDAFSLPPRLAYKRDKRALTEEQKLEKELERSNFASSVLVPRLNLHGTARQKHRIERKHHKAISAQVYHERNRINVGAAPADWRRVLELMVKSTPVQSVEYIEDGIKVELAEEHLARILRGAGDRAFGPIRRRTGAAIKVALDGSTVMLSGTRLAINMATEEFKSIAGKITVTRLKRRSAINMATEEFKSIAGKITVTRLYRPLDPGEADTEEVDLANHFYIPPLSRDEGAPARRKRLEQHVYTIPMPREWTPETLRDYVLSLIDTYVAKHLHAPLYPANSGAMFLDHERAVVRRLVRLFRVLPSAAGFSCSVLKLALSHMTSKGDKYGPEIRKLFTVFERLGTPMDTDVFNILLRGPVKMRHLRKFQQTIHKMTEHGCKPNLATWTLFLRLFQSMEVRSYILQAMHAKNLLVVPGAIQRIAEEMALYDAEYAVTQHKTIETFLKEQEVRYGSDWLTRDAGDKVLQVLCQYGRLDDVDKFLNLMGDRWYRAEAHEQAIKKPQSSTFLPIINQALVLNKVPLAVNMVRKMKTHKLHVRPTAEILDLLFKIAWNSRLRTTIAVIWRYASLARLTSHGMRRRVAMLLSGNVGSVTKEWDMTAKVYGSLGGEALAHELVGGRQVLEQIKALCRRTWGDTYPKRMLAAVAVHMLPTAFENCGPTVPLGTVLCQSVLVDQKCLRARKHNRLRDLLGSAQVKTVPLWTRLEMQGWWTDLGPTQKIAPSSIKYNDIWEDEWNSEGWNDMPALIAQSSDKGRKAGKTRELVDAASKKHSKDSQTIIGESGEVVQGIDNILITPDKLNSPASGAPEHSRMVMINPHIWSDEARDMHSVGDAGRTLQQLKDEKACLAAVEVVGKSRMSFRYMLTDGEPADDASGSEGREQDLDLASEASLQTESSMEEDRRGSADRFWEELCDANAEALDEDASSPGADEEKKEDVTN